MEIVKAETIRLKIPFKDGGEGVGLFPTQWNELDFLLLKLTTDSGLVGWGEAFSYFCAESVEAILERSLLPLLPGRDPQDAETLMRDLEHKVHIIGRYGITTFALSAIDIALWDLRAKAAGCSVADLLGGRKSDQVSAYASMVRYGDSELIARIATDAAADGYQTIKLHEITAPEIKACRQAIGPDIAITNDVNCNWSLETTRQMLEELEETNLYWLEEPIFPPEDFKTLSSLRGHGPNIALGENACTRWQFKHMIEEGAGDILQPSITKVGGISEYWAIEQMCAETPDVTLTPHSPYFGPGYLATMQMMSASENPSLFEYLLIEREACLYGSAIQPQDGKISIPDGPGLGLEPDMDVIEAYKI
ncbi:MAG: mandelate racemase/muconate lactonizing enzyme family protein [Hyphomicrobiales bacterium]